MNSSQRWQKVKSNQVFWDDVKLLKIKLYRYRESEKHGWSKGEGGRREGGGGVKWRFFLTSGVWSMYKGSKLFWEYAFFHFYDSKPNLT